MAVDVAEACVCVILVGSADKTAGVWIGLLR